MATTGPPSSGSISPPPPPPSVPQARIAVAALVARFGHGLGMLVSGSLAKRSPLKDGGAVLTYLTGITLGITALFGL